MTIAHHMPLVWWLAAWVRFADDTPGHRKVQPLSDQAHRLWFNLECWCSKNRTGGHFEYENAQANYPSRMTRKWLNELRVRRLVDDTPEGFKLHDFEVYNPDDEKTRKNHAERQQRYRDRLKAAAAAPLRDASRDASRDGGADAPSSHARAQPEPEPEKKAHPTRSTTTSRARRRVGGQPEQITPADLPLDDDDEPFITTPTPRGGV